MKSSSYPIRLSAEKKLELIKRVQNGESVTKLCRQHGISRTIFYRWLKEFKSSKYNQEEKALSAKYPKGKEHFRKLTTDKEREVVSLWLNNPDYSIRNIAKLTKVSVGGAWKIISKYKQSTIDSGKALKRYTKRKYKLFTASDKVAFLLRYASGEQITALCREAGVSRTIFYRWMKQYALSDQKDTAMERKYPRGENHWRFIPGIRTLIHENIIINPRLTLTDLLRIAQSKGQVVSRTGVYYMLKSMQLTTYQARLAYAESYMPTVIPTARRLPIQHFRINVPDFLPRFALLSMISVIGVYVFLFTLIYRPVTRIAPPIAINPTEAPAGTKLDDKAVIGQSDSDSKSRMEQDFKWGALALNTSGNGDLPKDGTLVGFGVVDHLGQTICDAELSLEVTSSSKDVKIGELSTDNGKIKQSGECAIRSVTNTADYLAELPTLKDGVYSIRVNAKTYEGEKEFKQKLIVRNNQPIDVERYSYPSRIFPYAAYPVEIVIKPNKNFKGTVSENLPNGITASDISGAGMIQKSKGNDRIMEWTVDLKKGQTYKISYNLHFPKIWPEFYEIGPMKFTDFTGKLISQEAKSWKIVADSL